MIITDNRPQFRKHTAFASLVKEFNVHHHKVTPYNPQAKVERFIKNLKKLFKLQ